MAQNAQPNNTAAAANPPKTGNEVAGAAGDAAGSFDIGRTVPADASSAGALDFCGVSAGGALVWPADGFSLLPASAAGAASCFAAGAEGAEADAAPANGKNVLAR